MATSGREYANVDLNMKRMGFVLKTTRFNDLKSTLSFEKTIHGALSDFKLCRMLSFT